MTIDVEGLRALLGAATEPPPAPLPEQDTRIGEAMAGRRDDENRRAWIARTDAARRGVVEATPALLDEIERLRASCEKWEGMY